MKLFVLFILVVILQLTSAQGGNVLRHAWDYLTGGTEDSNDYDNDEESTSPSTRAHRRHSSNDNDNDEESNDSSSSRVSRLVGREVLDRVLSTEGDVETKKNKPAEGVAKRSINQIRGLGVQTSPQQHIQPDTPASPIHPPTIEEDTTVQPEVPQNDVSVPYEEQQELSMSDSGNVPTLWGYPRMGYGAYGRHGVGYGGFGLGYRGYGGRFRGYRGYGGRGGIYRRRLGYGGLGYGGLGYGGYGGFGGYGGGYRRSSYRNSYSGYGRTGYGGYGGYGYGFPVSAEVTDGPQAEDWTDDDYNQEVSYGSKHEHSPQVVVVVVPVPQVLVVPTSNSAQGNAPMLPLSRTPLNQNSPFDKHAVFQAMYQRQLQLQFQDKHPSNSGGYPLNSESEPSNTEPKQMNPFIDFLNQPSEHPQRKDTSTNPESSTHKKHHTPTRKMVQRKELDENIEDDPSQDNIPTQYTIGATAVNPWTGSWQNSMVSPPVTQGYDGTWGGYYPGTYQYNIGPTPFGGSAGYSVSYPGYYGGSSGGRMSTYGSSTNYGQPWLGTMGGQYSQGMSSSSYSSGLYTGGGQTGYGVGGIY